MPGVGHAIILVIVAVGGGFLSPVFSQASVLALSWTLTSGSLFCSSSAGWLWMSCLRVSTSFFVRWE
jgi:hypothetical protein